jgi:hypothetical protein
MLRVIPDQQGSIASHHAQWIFDRSLQMQLCMDWQVNPKQLADILEVGTRGIDEYRGIDAFSRTEPDSRLHALFATSTPVTRADSNRTPFCVPFRGGTCQAVAR